jgi:hypothetical protein
MFHFREQLSRVGKRQHLTCVKLNILSLRFTFLEAEFVVCRLAARRRSSRGGGLAASGNRGRFCFAPLSRRRAEDILQGLKLLLQARMGKNYARKRLRPFVKENVIRKYKFSKKKKKKQQRTILETSFILCVYCSNFCSYKIPPPPFQKKVVGKPSEKVQGKDE